MTAPTTPRCQVTATASPSSFGASGGNGTVAVTTTRDCTWSATPGAPWLTLGSPSSGQGTGSFDFAVAANGDVAARSTTVDVNGQKVTISEQAAACAYAVSPNAVDIPSSGGSFAVSVQTQGTCPWTAASNDPWVVVRTASGTGSATVQLAVAANSGAGRTATLVIAGQTITVTQATGGAPPPPPPIPPPPPAPGCSYALTPTSQSFSAAGGTGTVAVGTTATCAWTATSNAPWISLPSGASGLGPGTLSYAVAANADVARTGTITIADQTFTVSQAAAVAPPPPPPACSYSVSPGNQKIDGAGGQLTFSVSAGPTCAWTATTTDSWLSIASGASGAGSGLVVVNVQANGGGPRNGTVTIAGQTVGVKQNGADAAANGPVAALSGSCPDLRFSVTTSRIITDSSTAFRRGPCKNVEDGVVVSVQGSLQSDLAVLASDVTFSGKV
ncbi:MAG: BACON domain-containing protein [Bacteroidales bacterium]